MRFKIFILVPLAAVLTACPPSYDDVIRKVRSNNMDLPNPQPMHELGLAFNLSDLFAKDSYTNLTFGSNKAVGYATQYNEILFSIEEMSDKNTKIASALHVASTQLESVRVYAITKRVSHYENAKISEPIELYSLTKKKGWLNLISIEEDYSSPSYLIAAIAYKGKYYIIQLVTSKEYNDYFYNDFLDILKSIK